MQVAILILGVIIGGISTQSDIAKQIDNGYVDCWFRDKVGIVRLGKE